MTETPQQTKTHKFTSRTGMVASVSGRKTVSVVVNNLVRHPRYGKYIRRRTKLAVHDPASQAAVGDLVEIVPCRPISKRKSWRLLRVVRTSATRD